MTTTPAPAPDEKPCPDCGQVHPDLSALEGMSAQQLHDIATAALAKAAQAIIEAGEPGQFPDLEQAMTALNWTAREVLRERLLETLLGKGRDIVNASARKSQAPAPIPGQQAIEFPEAPEAPGKVGPYL